MNEVLWLDALFLAFVYQIKHFLSDYILQTGRFFLGKFSANTKEWIPALSVHCFVHGISTYYIASTWLISKSHKDVFFVLSLSLFDASIHFMMDRLKASPHMWGRYGATKNTKPWFWWALGFDQMIHHLTHYIIILFMIDRVAL